jgi:hypothetical protein
MHLHNAFHVRAPRKQNSSLGRPSFCLNWQSSLLPCLESTLKGPDVFVTAFLKFLRQTGARALAWSSAVRDDGPAFRNSGKVLVEFVRRQSYRFWNLRIRFCPSLGIADIDYGKIFPCFHSPFQLVDCDSRGISHKVNLLAFSARIVDGDGGIGSCPLTGKQERNPCPLQPRDGGRNVQAVMPKTPKKKQETKDDSDKLRGWQQIADFLGQPVSVAQRWAKSSMPVTREGRHVQA